MQNQTAVVLLNLGSPASPSPSDVRVYLKEFLNDPYVIDTSWIVRKLLVDLVILNTRPPKTAEAYQQVWTDRGSPLIFHTQDLAEKVQSKIDSKYKIFWGMRYGSPSIEETIAKLKEENFSEIIFIPLYPQYSFAATETAIERFEKLLKPALPNARLRIVEDFYNHPLFIEALRARIAPRITEFKPDLLLLSYHGIPERQIAKTKNKKDYRAQCYETSRLLANALGLKDDQYFVSFQSRLGRTKWIEPYTDVILKDLTARGVKRLLVASPSFTADCLETLEEIQIRYQELFMEVGGTAFEYVPCVNSEPEFVKAIQEIILER